jgi:putative tryptophan/tyrosine transport system substrate-binding protein
VAARGARAAAGQAADYRGLRRGYSFGLGAAGRPVAIEYRWADGRSERFADIAAEFVRLKVDVIVTGQSTVTALRQATSAIPIVLAIATDPIGTGTIASLARPGGNVTGLSLQAPDLAGKRLELLREVVPGLHRLAILANTGYPAAVLEMNEFAAAAQTLGFDVVRLEVRRAEDIAPVFEAHKDRADAVYITSDALLNSNRIRINTLANVARMPTISAVKEFVEAGGLPMDRAIRSCSGVPQTMSIKFYAARSRLAFRSSSRPNSISSST